MMNIMSPHSALISRKHQTWTYLADDGDKLLSGLTWVPLMQISCAVGDNDNVMSPTVYVYASDASDASDARKTFSSIKQNWNPFY